MNFGDFIDDQWTEKNTGRCILTYKTAMIFPRILAADSQVLNGLFRFITFRKDLPHRLPFACSKTTTTEHLHDLADKTTNGPPVRNTSPREKN